MYDHMKTSMKTGDGEADTNGVSLKLIRSTVGAVEPEDPKKRARGGRLVVVIVKGAVDRMRAAILSVKLGMPGNAMGFSPND